MSQGPSVTDLGALASVSGAEKHARLDTSGRNETKLRSCVVCRSRKVRCDKRAPCSNCRRANIACVFPPTDRPPRWARRLDRNSASSNPQTSQADPIADGVMERLHNLENLVKELSSQLEQAKSAANSTAEGSSGVGSPEGSTHDRQPNPSAGTNNVQSRFGRLVLQDSNRSRYVSSGFWSRVDDELDSLKADARGLSVEDYETSDDDFLPDKTPSTQELEQSPAARHGFLFGHNLSSYSPDLSKLHPLPSQIPFLLDVFAENVNAIIQIVHLPTIRKMVRDWRGRDMQGLSPANEALMFSIYYAAVTSMEEEDITLNFGATKSELNLRYRQGLEHALARADFLNVPDLVLVQAFSIFLALVRRHDSPRFVWMMTGLAIRMGQALGLHRDGSNFNHLTPYEIEMRRRVWWVLCLLDVRASEDQGTDYTIPSASFDTKLPLNLNDADLDPESKRVPQERDSLSDMSVARVSFGMCKVARKMMAHGLTEKAPSPEEQSRLLKEIYQGAERDFLQYSTESGNVTYWALVIVARLVMAKMTLLVYLPLLFSSKDDFSDELRTRLLISGIEVAEYNHALNNEQACRQWRWAFQTYTHWYSIVYMMMEISRRPWSPISERAWVALHSVWLIPSQSHMNKNLRIWIPLRKLMGKAREYRQMELGRLRSDPKAAQLLEQDYQSLPVPSSSGPFPLGTNSVDLFLERWRELLLNHDDLGESASPFGFGRTNSAQPPMDSPRTTQLTVHPTVTLPASGIKPPAGQGQLPGALWSKVDVPTMASGTNIEFESDQPVIPLNNQLSTASALQYGDPGIASWLWPDDGISINVANLAEEPVDYNMEIDGEADWYNWVESVKSVEWDGLGDNAQS